MNPHCSGRQGAAGGPAPERVPGDQLSRRCVIGDNDAVTLEFLMKDYVVHLKHHLQQILG